MKVRTVAFFPPLSVLRENPYWPILAASLQMVGVELIEDTPYSFGLFWLLKNRLKIHVLHLHFVQGFYKGRGMFLKVLRFGALLVIARLLGYCTVFTLHNLEPTYPLKPVWLDYLGHWMAANLSSKVIVYCDTSRILLKKKYGRKSRVFQVEHPNVIQYYPNVVSQEEARKQLGLSKEHLVFIFFGGVRPNKGIETLIQSFQKLEGENYRLLIAGKIFPPDSYARSLQEMACADPRIMFYLQYIPDDEVQIFLNASDVVVLPFARILTSGTTVLAMSFHRAVIVPRMGCLPELVEPDVGWTFNPRDPEALLNAMRTAVASDFKQIGENAFRKISVFTPQRFAEQTLWVYEKG